MWRCCHTSSEALLIIEDKASQEGHVAVKLIVLIALAFVSLIGLPQFSKKTLIHGKVDLGRKLERKVILPKVENGDKWVVVTSINYPTPTIKVSCHY